MEQNTLTLHLDEANIARVLSLHEGHLKEPPNEYIQYFIQDEDLTISVFKKVKNGLHAVTFQGKNASYEAKIFGYEEPPELPPLNQPIIRKDKSFKPQIGSDEVGTGDYFGPVIVVAAYCGFAELKKLQELGVTDSKLLSDADIMEIGPTLISEFDFSLLCLMPEKYNELKLKGNNMNSLKAKLHNRALLNMAKKHPGIPLYQDQFAEPTTYYRYLAKQEEVARNITFATKGELKFPSVALASCIARFHFLRRMKAMAEELGVDEIPLGAGPIVDEFAKKIYATVGEENFPKYVKINFANTKRVLE